MVHHGHNAKYPLLTLVSVTLGDANDIDHLILSEDVGDLDLLLEAVTGEVNLGKTTSTQETSEIE